MKKLFSFKKMSSKITFVVAAAVILAGGAASIYMQTRIISEIDNHSRLFVRYNLINIVDDTEVAFAYGLSISEIENIVSRTTLYETGFALMADDTGTFFQTNDLARRLSATERNQLTAANQREAFDISFAGTSFVAAQMELRNGYSMFVLAPRSEVMAEVNASIMRFLIIFVVVVTLVIIIASRIGKSMAAPLVVMKDLISHTGATGDITIHKITMRKLVKVRQNKDEIGQCVDATLKLFEHINNISEQLEILAEGDLTVENEMLSDKDMLGNSVSKMVEKFTELFEALQASAHQVSSGSKQIADGAQALAQGSTEQSATVQQLSSSIAAISEQTSHNAEMAGKAARLADAIIGNAEKGNKHMGDMIDAVHEINQASQSISKVIKVIDDIAFQTNILALNAAVEAARAGQHGKGFAVVAEEVRNLAAKSAEAAKDTSGLIANSMEKAALGARIAGDTAASLDEIVSGINESSVLIGDIAKSSEEQSTGITQINNGIDQVAQVVSQNSATAQQSAAASQQMSGQSELLQQMIAQFKLKETNKLRPGLPRYPE